MTDSPAPASGMYAIEVNDARSSIAVDSQRLRTIAADVLRHEQVESAEISIALIEGETMRRLNRDHLGHDYDTDVLSFLLDCQGPAVPQRDGPRGAGKSIDGEVLIGTDVAVRAAAEVGWSPDSEVTLYLVHGLLHLAGYDDLSGPERKVMRAREAFHLARWGLAPAHGPEDDLHAGPAGRSGPSSGEKD